MVDISKIDMDRIEGLIEKLNSMKYVVETGSNENGWYRKWSDGFIEQWGIFDTNNRPQTINLPISFSNTSYYINCIPRRTNTGSAGWNYHIIIKSSVTESSFQILIADGDGLNWYACGY